MTDKNVLTKHESAIRHHDEMLYIHEHQKVLKPGEKRGYFSAVRRQLEIEIKMHELYVLVKDRVERYGG